MRRNMRLALCLVLLACNYNSATADTALIKVAKQATGIASKSAQSSNIIKKITRSATNLYRAAKEYVGFKPSPDAIDQALETPKNQCSLPKEGDAEKKIYASLSGDGSTPPSVIRFSVLCSELPKFWEGTEPSKWSIYRISPSLPEVPTRSGLISEMTRTEPRFEITQLSKIVKAVERTENPSEAVGIYDVTPEAVYVASLALSNREDTNGPKIAHISGVRLINNRVVGLNLYAIFKNKQTFEELLLDTKDAVSRSIRRFDNSITR